MPTRIPQAQSSCEELLRVQGSRVKNTGFVRFPGGLGAKIPRSQCGGVPGSIPGQGTISQVWKLKVCMSQLEIT